jgi:ABC-type transport system substrate-binding protein
MAKRLVVLVIAAVVLFGLLIACATPAATALPAKPTAPASAPTAVPAAASAPVLASTQPAVVATAAPTTAPVVKIKRGGALREAATAVIPTLDPQFSNSFTQTGHRMIFDALFRYELVDEKAGKHEVKGELVESWQMVDPTTFTFKLRSGVKFHDGSDWNAQGAKFNLERMLTNKKSTAKTYVEGIKSVDLVDPMTIKLSLQTPSAALLVNLSGVTSPVSIVSQKAVESMGEDAFNNKPVGSGPFEVVEWLRDNRVNTKKFNGYWRMGEDGQPLPYLDTAVFRSIIDPSVMLIEMKAGTLDIIAEPDAKDVAGIKASPDMVYYQHPSAINGRTMGVNQKQGPFANNLKLRQALMYAIDREAMNKTLAFGIGQPYKWLYWPPGYAGYDTSLPFYNFDPARSKQLLAEAAVPAGT